MTTPMMRQYREAKERYPGMVVLFRMGDFYELFDDDAREIAPVLNITLTTRDGAMPMAGFPHHALESHLRKLLVAGKRVAVCDQVEDAAQAKGLVRREVTRVVTPGTLTEDDLLDPRRPSHLVAITKGPKDTFGVAWVDLGRGRVFAADAAREAARDLVGGLEPAELLHPDSRSGRMETLALLGDQPWLTPRPDWHFEDAESSKLLQGQFGVSTMAGFGFDDRQPCLRAAGALLAYLKETVRTGLPHLDIRPHLGESALRLDETTRRNLEITGNQRDNGREGSLLAAVDRARTAMGSRLLREWLLEPAADAALIGGRHDSVGSLVEADALRGALREQLGAIGDLQRVVARAATLRASPRDLAQLSKALSKVPVMREAAFQAASNRSAHLRALAERIDPCGELADLLARALADEPSLVVGEGHVIREGFDASLDEWRHARQRGASWLAEYQAAQIARTGINSLKVGFNQVFGYYIEVTQANISRVPADYQRKQTLKNAERFITPELLAFQEKALGADEGIAKRELELFTALREAVSRESARLRSLGDALAELDTLASFAELARDRGHCRPSIVTGPILEIDQGRHPVLDVTLPTGTVVPNDLALGGSGGGTLHLVTGPNMGGKSVFIRQSALLVVMAQSGAFVPARAMRFGLADRLFARVGAGDNLARAQSTFMVEMVETATILNNATGNSLVILDEIGRGTSTYDGVSLAWAIAEDLHDRIRCRCLFATHYHELAQLAERLSGVRACRAEVLETDRDITLLHRVVPGTSDRSYGIHVAARAGIPSGVLERARALLAELEARHARAPAADGGTIRNPRLVQSSLFAGSDDPVLAEIAGIDPRSLTGEAAIALLARWKRELAG
ncbi:MAG: DNA mismatch repair protein MutS [Planctomycetes bacterium]|nr:DNA mismatch repair protein MutS [Planctomycetota bacterium]